MDAAMNTLKTKNLLTTKSAQESRGERVAEGETADDESDVAQALAVDLNEWKLGKPVVQKGGMWFLLCPWIRIADIIIRRSDYLHHARCCWGAAAPCRIQF